MFNNGSGCVIVIHVKNTYSVIFKNFGLNFIALKYDYVEIIVN